MIRQHGGVALGLDSTLPCADASGDGDGIFGDCVHFDRDGADRIQPQFAAARASRPARTRAARIERKLEFESEHGAIAMAILGDAF